MTKKKLFSIVIPVYGNEKNIPITIPYFIDHLSLFPNYEVELIMVCDGSPDHSYEEMKKVQELYPDYVRIVCFTRNFGQGAAIHCGLDLARGDVIGVISCDMQDPFELFVDMIAAWEEGYKLVIANRKKRDDKGLSVIASKMLHTFVHNFISDRYPVGGFDFFLMDRVVSEKVRSLDAANGSIQMLIIWLGYRYKMINYERQERKIGKSGYKFRRKFSIVLGLITTYSPMMSQVWGFCGMGLSVTGFVLFVLSVVFALVTGAAGWMCSVVVFSVVLALGILLCAISSIGEYVWRTFDMTKKRPRYVIEEMNV